MAERSQLQPISEKRKIDKVDDDMDQMLPSSTSTRIRCMRVKDVGTRITSIEQRNKRIIQLAHPLPEGNLLSGRAIYWFVTTESVEFTIEDPSLFIWQEKLVVSNSDGIHYLNQINFARNKRGVLNVVFPNGGTESIVCYSTNHTKSNKRIKLTTVAPNPPIDNNPLTNQMQFNSHNNFATVTFDGTDMDIERLLVMAEANYTNINNNNYDDDGNNTNQQYYQNEVISPLDVSEDIAQASQTPTVQAASLQRPLPPKTIVNLLLLVPDPDGTIEYIEMVDRALVKIGFTKEVTSSANQRLYHEKDLVNFERNILVFPYRDIGRVRRVQDYLVATSEVLLLLVNDKEQPDDFVVVEGVSNVNKSNWELTIRGINFKSVDLDYNDLNMCVGLLVCTMFGKLVIGGAMWRQSLDIQRLQEHFSNFFLQWILPAYKGTGIPQNIYLCFKYESNVKPLSEYASITLAALGIEAEPFVANGSAIVYLQCPSYMPWCIQMNYKTFEEVAFVEGLKEIYECGISDIDASIQLPINAILADELVYLKEMMIADRVTESNKRFRLVFDNSKAPRAVFQEEKDEPKSLALEIENLNLAPTLDGLPAEKRKILVEKYNKLKMFDNKWSKTLEDCYDSESLMKQLFNFNTDKSKFAVRVFISSAPTGLATNVAKLMKPYDGQSIVDGVHTGLQIANTIVEWNQSGIVHIGELKHTSAVAVLYDVQEVDLVKYNFSEEKAKKMVSFIQRWNTERHYSSTLFNSHRFVRDFLQETLDVSLVERFKGPLGWYMDQVMQTGDITPRLITKHGVLVFETHKELEAVDNAIRGKLKDDEVKLLKIFHRGFQLQEAAHNQDVSSCCYGLPTNGLEILNESGKPVKY